MTSRKSFAVPRPAARHLLALLLAGGLAADAAAQAGERFGIQYFEVRGARALSVEELRVITAPYTGRDRNFADVQKVVDAIESAYQRKGYGAVQVLLPEQDITQGGIVVEVVETPLGSVTIKGNRQFSTDNIARGLPALRPGATPNVREISENVQLANENGAKQVNVVLGVGAAENTVDARVEVKEDRIARFFVSADNTGTEPTGKYRVSAGYLHNNVFDRDHTASASYTTSPDKPDNVDIHVVSLAYRVPFYGLGDSLSLIYGYSNIETATTSALGSGLSINGKGHLLAARWNHYLGRQGEFSSQLIGGIDLKAVRSACVDSNGAAVTGTAGCIDYTTTPVSLTYTGRRDGVGTQYDYSAGLAYNLPSGDDIPYPNATTPDGSDRYTLAAGNRKASDNFYVLRFAGSFTTSWNDWLTRAALTGQVSPKSALVGAEQIGLAGSQAVRGFLDRVVVADTGAVINLEAYSPELAPKLGLDGHALRGLVFVDYAKGRDNHAGGTATKELASWGFGLRYQWGKDVALRADAASILRAKPDNVYRGTDPAGGVLDDNNKGDWRGHLSVTVSF